MSRSTAAAWYESSSVPRGAVRTRLGMAPNHPSFRAGVLRTHMLTGLIAHAAADRTGTQPLIFARFDDTDAQRSGRVRPESLLREIIDVAQVPLAEIPPEVGDSPEGIYESRRTERYQDAVEILRGRGVILDSGGVAFLEVAALDDALRDRGIDAHALVASSVTNVARVPLDHAQERVPLTRADGSPLWHLTTVVDDIDLGVNLVIRATDKTSAVAVQERLRWVLTDGAQQVAYVFVPRLLEPGQPAGRSHVGGDRGGSRTQNLIAKHIRPSALRWYLAEPFCVAPKRDLPQSFAEIVPLLRRDAWPMGDAFFDLDRLVAIDRKMSVQLRAEASYAELLPYVGEDDQELARLIAKEWRRGLEDQIRLYQSVKGFEVNYDPPPVDAADAIDWCAAFIAGERGPTIPFGVRWILTGRNSGPTPDVLLTMISQTVVESRLRLVRTLI